jgi:hypothetical protein
VGVRADVYLHNELVDCIEERNRCIGGEGHEHYYIVVDVGRSGNRYLRDTVGVCGTMERVGYYSRYRSLGVMDFTGVWSDTTKFTVSVVELS